MQVSNSFTPLTTILSSEVNANFTDFATEVTNSLPRDGQAGMSGPLRLDDGLLALPGLAFVSDVDTGFRRSGTNEMRWVGGATDRMFIDAAGKAWFIGALDVAGAFTCVGAALSGNLTVNSIGATEELHALHYSADGNGSIVRLAKSRNAAVGGHTIVQSGDDIGTIFWGGSDGTNFEFAAALRAVVDGTPGNNDMPGALVFFTAADGGVTLTERMAIRQDGLIQVPNRSAPLIQLAPTGYMDISEIADPGAPAANVLRLFALDVGGTTRLAYLDSADALRVLDRAGEVIAIIEDQKAQNTAAQTLTADTDNVRELTTLAYNRDTLVSLGSNQFTLPAGTWEIEWYAPVGSPAGTDAAVAHQSFLYNATDTAEVARGVPGRVDTATDETKVTQPSLGSAVVTIAGAKAFEIRHRPAAANLLGGELANLGTEVYARVTVRRA